MEYTSNFNLKKPGLDDMADIADINDNMDVIDEKMKEALDNEALKTDVAEIKTGVEDLQEKVGTTTDGSGSSTAGSIFAKLNQLITDAATMAGRWTQSRADKVDSIGETTDSGATENSGTLMGKANAILKEMATNTEVDEIKSILQGSVTPYGTGQRGNVTYSPETFLWGNKDLLNRYVLQCGDFVIPEGVTMRPPSKTDMVVLFSTGNVTINGTLDLTSCRQTLTNDVAIEPTLSIDGTEYKLAIGGDTVNGGSGGNGGNVTYRGTSNIQATGGNGHIISEKNTVPGSVIGGGLGYYGSGGKGAHTSMHNNDGWEQNFYNGADGVLTKAENAPCALVIVAKGTVTITGKIDASASNGILAEDGKSYSNSSYSDYAGDGGNGAVPPSGGGAVTIICSSFALDGIGMIDVRGKKFTSNNGNKFPTVGDWSGGYDTDYGTLTQPSGGTGGTFTSTSGEIRVYERGV